jgi:hypothetical protein
METTHRREQLARQVAGTVYAGGDPAAAEEAAGFNTAITHRPDLVVAATGWTADVLERLRRVKRQVDPSNVFGSLTLTVGDEGRKVEAGAGTYVLVPAGTLHAITNSGATDVRFLNVHAPGGFDRRIGLGPGQ